MERVDMWTRELQESVEGKVGVPFEWGKNDCALFACDIMKAITGRDPGRWFRGKYDTAVGALRSLAESPFGLDNKMRGFDEIFPTVVRELALDHEMKYAIPEKCRRGDLALVETRSGRPAMGIFYGASVITAARPRGFAHYSFCDVMNSWRIE